MKKEEFYERARAHIWWMKMTSEVFWKPPEELEKNLPPQWRELFDYWESEKEEKC